MQCLLRMSPETRDIFFMSIGLNELVGSKRVIPSSPLPCPTLLLEKGEQIYAIVMARSFNDRAFYRRSFRLLNVLSDLYDQDIQVFCLSYQLHFYPVIRGTNLWDCLKKKRSL